MCKNNGILHHHQDTQLKCISLKSLFYRANIECSSCHSLYRDVFEWLSLQKTTFTRMFMEHYLLSSATQGNSQVWEWAFFHHRDKGRAIFALETEECG
ncbi:hypothetical protein CEXT_394291 [Caerostris extrusa]|uniref:Uncharacterized protein n=1 Tax=Caerostris extrusa TaxID=172846 RepID=A0AAV4XKX4_CAEEX|nr:hypothetical protein CEXT_394291 [Caerostris extrusa]